MTLKNQTVNWRLWRLLSLTSHPWTPTCVCLFMYIHSLVSIHFVFLQYFTHICECVNECVCMFPSEEALMNPHSAISNIWLRMYSLYLQVICPVKPLGAASVHIITALLRLRLELRWNPIVWFKGVQICWISFYTTSSGPSPICCRLVFGVCLESWAGQIVNPEGFSQNCQVGLN